MLFILTGAPGSGKTSILATLDPDIRIIAEPAREILAEQRAIDGTGVPDRDPSLFNAQLLQRSIDKVLATEDDAGPVVFDRGIPDCIAYATVLGVDPASSVEAAQTYRYHHEVLILPPWEEIYTTDDERRMSFADTGPFHDALVDAYERTGYILVEVPRGPIDRRASFVDTFLRERDR